ncbi:MAG TPA: hypothetical protein VGL66_08920 [Caulobacteraceae bacterium]|jgi:hypothetical protein
MTDDPELAAMAKILAALSDLDPPARARVFRWIHAKLDLTPQAEAPPKTAMAVDPTTATERAIEDRPKFEASLASHIRSKGAEGNQVLRFLVTSDWLRQRQKPLAASAVAKALQDNQQARLANPADCLNKNVAKGFCEKTKDGFFITPEGLRELGYQ